MAHKSTAHNAVHVSVRVKKIEKEPVAIIVSHASILKVGGGPFHRYSLP